MKEPNMEDVEELSEKIHKVYCSYFQDRHNKPYWTNGRYKLLDEKTKEADRYMAKFIIKNFIPRIKPNIEKLAEIGYREMYFSSCPSQKMIRTNGPCFKTASPTVKIRWRKIVKKLFVAIHNAQKEKIGE